ncbi:MAG TPA: glycoside hydrolase [Cyanothece sp. UBA12306]|nr:glycoside hydrolase [Cyanothece sp. UBA12306]
MRILVLTWEFPPRIVGGIARHVAELYPEMVKLGHEIHLITIEFEDTANYEVIEGIHIYRVPVEEGDSFFHWVTNMNDSMGHQGGELLRNLGVFDLIHAHDWLVGDAAIALKHYFKIPLIVTIHATEYGRHNGLHSDTQRYIANKEEKLIYNAWRVIVCSNYMYRELQHIFHTPADKIDVIFNGIRPEKKKLNSKFDQIDFRRRFAKDNEKIIYYVGRMSYEKGVSVLLQAATKVFSELEGDAKLVIIGGGNTQHLQNQACQLGIREKCDFTGFMSDEDLDKFQTLADCAVFPSLYEPFGIVALESFAAKVPVVVSNAGGLPEVVLHGQTGIVTYANNADSLAWGILEVLKNHDYAQWLVENAYHDLESRFNWTKLAQQTEMVYNLVAEQCLQTIWV